MHKIFNNMLTAKIENFKKSRDELKFQGKKKRRKKKGGMTSCLNVARPRFAKARVNEYNCAKQSPTRINNYLPYPMSHQSVTNCHLDCISCSTCTEYITMSR